MKKKTFVNFLKKQGYDVKDDNEGYVWFWKGRYLFEFRSCWNPRYGWDLWVWARHKPWIPEKVLDGSAYKVPGLWYGYYSLGIPDFTIRFTQVRAGGAYKKIKKFLLTTNVKALIVASKL